MTGFGARARILGALIGGGKSKRFGGDKAAALWRGRTLASHAKGALHTHCTAVVICGGADAGHGRIADRPHAGCGPLGGLNAALHYAAAQGFDTVLSVPVDVHPLPRGLLDILYGPDGSDGPIGIEAPRVFRKQRMIGLWPAALSPLLDQHLAAGHHSVHSWLKASGATEVEDSGFGLINVNYRDDLGALERRAAP